METNGDLHTQELQQALAYAENIIATLREPFLVLDKNLRVRTANAAFYRDFHVSKEETEGRFVYDLGSRQWDIPQLRALLSQVLSNSEPVEDFEVDHTFPALGGETCCSTLAGSLLRATSRPWCFSPSGTLRYAVSPKRLQRIPRFVIGVFFRPPRTVS